MEFKMRRLNIRQLSFKLGIKILNKSRAINKCLIALLFVLLIFSGGCGLNLKPYSREFFAMDTLITIELYAKNDALGSLALNKAEEEFYRIARLTTRFSSPDTANTKEETGNLQFINANTGREVEIDPELWYLLSRCRIWGERTNGAFDISLGAVSDLWDFQHGGQIPDKEELAEVLEKTGFEKVFLVRDVNRVLIEPGVSLDLGAMAKGYATDKAAQILRELGIKHALINAGGNVYTLGCQPTGEPWRVGIKHPRKADEYLEILEAADTAIVTSGDYQRNFISDEGILYHHILNPETGFPATESISVTVIGPSSFEADILSTALFVMGNKKGPEFAKNFPQFKTIFYEE